MLKNKLIIFFVLIATLFSTSTGVFAAPEGIYMENSKLDTPAIDSEAAILMDMKTGRVIYSKNPQQKMYPASTTKIMTGILALEYGNLSDVVTASVAALAPITNEDSHMGILIGEQLTMEQLIYGAMVASANDAANVIATHIAGSPENFVDMMNQKAQELGAVNTNFVNTYGIHDDNHYTTAEDLTIMARYAMQNEKFREIVKTSTYKIPPTEKYTTERVLASTNLFLSKTRSAQFYYEPVNGIKTGSTDAAGYCLVSSAEYEGTELLAVTLKAPNRAACYTDSKKLLSMGFNNYTYTTVAAKGDVIHNSKVYEAKDDTRVALTVSQDISALLPKDIDMAAELVITPVLPEVIKSPIKKDDVIGSISYSYNGNIIGQADLIAINEVKRNNLLFLYHLVIRVLTSPIFFIPAILIIVLLLIRRSNIKKQEKLKRKRRLQNAQRAAQNRAQQNQRPVNPDRYSNTGTRKNPNSRYRK